MKSGNLSYALTPNTWMTQSRNLPLYGIPRDLKRVSVWNAANKVVELAFNRHPADDACAEEMSTSTFRSIRTWIVFFHEEGEAECSREQEVSAGSTLGSTLEALVGPTYALMNSGRQAIVDQIVEVHSVSGPRRDGNNVPAKQSCFYVAGRGAVETNVRSARHRCDEYRKFVLPRISDDECEWHRLADTPENAKLVAFLEYHRECTVLRRLAKKEMMHNGQTYQVNIDQYYWLGKQEGGGKTYMIAIATCGERTGKTMPTAYMLIRHNGTVIKPGSEEWKDVKAVYTYNAAK